MNEPTITGCVPVYNTVRHESMLAQEFLRRQTAIDAEGVVAALRRIL